MAKSMTPPQSDYIHNLLGARQVPATVAQAFHDNFSNYTVQEASVFISYLKGLPFKKTEDKPVQPVTGLDLRTIPSGRYAAQDEEGVMRFFKIDNLSEVQNSKWSGWVFVKRQSSDNLLKCGAQRPGQSYTGKSLHALTTIVSDPLTACKIYGHAKGVCGKCGRTLTDPESIENGIGPICAQMF